MKVFRKYSCIALALAAMLSVFAGCKKEKVEVKCSQVKVERGDILQTVPAVGEIVPERQVDIQAEIGGIVKAVHYDVGDTVPEGALIIELRDTDLKMQVMQAEARRAEAAARLNSVKDQPRDIDLVSAENNVAEAKRKLGHAELNLERIEKLHEQGFRSDADLDNAKYEKEIAMQSWQSAGDYLEELKKGATQQEIEAAESQLNSARAALDIAKENLSKTMIYAPISGQVIRRNVEVGDAVSPGTAQGGTSLIEIADTGTLYFEGRVDEKDVASVEIGQDAVIKVDAMNKAEFSGEVIRLAPAAGTNNSRLRMAGNDNQVEFPIKIRITGDKGGLLTGMRAEADIQIKKFEDVLMVPLLAVKFLDDKEVVYLPPKGEGALPEHKEITTGIDDGKNLVVESGVDEGLSICEDYFPETKKDEEDF